MMLPLLPVRAKQRMLGHASTFAATIACAVTLSADVGPLRGLPCCSHVTPPSLVETTVPIAPSAKQLNGSRHAMPLSAWALCDVCGAHVAPPSVDFSSTALPPTTAPTTQQAPA